MIGLFKTEVIRRRGPWRRLEAVEFATPERVDWFDTRRLLEPIGNIPPAEAERRHHAGNVDDAVAARRKPNGIRETRGGSPLFLGQTPRSTMKMRRIVRFPEDSYRIGGRMPAIYKQRRMRCEASRVRDDNYP